MQEQIGLLEQEVNTQVGVLSADIMTLCELAGGGDDRAAPAAYMLETLCKDRDAIGACGPPQVAALA
eukprot:scaffold674989_cov43-Prasinocladus_malaysianus.AAC.1